MEEHSDDDAEDDCHDDFANADDDDGAGELFREDREGAGVFGRCPGLHEGRTSVTRGVYARVDPGYSQVTPDEPGSPVGPTEAKRRLHRRSCAGHARVIPGILVAYIARWRHGKGTRVAAGLQEGDTRVMPGSATVTPGAHHPGNPRVELW